LSDIWPLNLANESGASDIQDRT